MPEMTGTILYVNPPKAGQRSGSLKFDNNERVGVLPNQLGLFQRGQTVSIEYKDRQGSDGKWWKDFVSFSGEAPAPLPGYNPRPPAPAYRQPPPQVSRPAAPRPPAPQAPRQGSGGPHDYNTGKQICVTGITQRFVQAGNVPVADIPTIMRLVAMTYDDIFMYGEQGLNAPAPRQTAPASGYGQAGPRDEIPPVQDEGEYFDDPVPF